MGAGRARGHLRRGRGCRVAEGCQCGWAVVSCLGLVLAMGLPHFGDPGGLGGCCWICPFGPAGRPIPTGAPVSGCGSMVRYSWSGGYQGEWMRCVPSPATPYPRPPTHCPCYFLGLEALPGHSVPGHGDSQGVAGASFPHQGSGLGLGPDACHSDVLNPAVPSALELCRRLPPLLPGWKEHLL